MSEARDPAFKLFGKTISLPGNEEIPAFCGASAHEESLDHDGICPSTNSKEKISEGGDEQGEEKDSWCRTPTETKEKDGATHLNSEQLTDHAMPSGNNENPNTPSVEIETGKTKASGTEETQSETSSSQEKTILKKPDKILPCPRCNSMDTKFCYYNNYNVNQPRHFCKNCQRYWTAGGTMRAMAVGAGRRKTKNSASQYRHISVSEALQTARADAPDGIHHPHSTLKPNGTILTFGSDTHLCESMASALNLADKTTNNCTRIGLHKPEPRIPVSCVGGVVGEEKSKGSSVTASSSMEEGRRFVSQEQMMQNCPAFPPQIPCFPGAPWPYPWNSTQWTSAVPPPPPTFCPNFPVPFNPSPTYWGCPVPSPWSIPWLTPPSSSSNQGGGPGCGPLSPTLGKHSREGDVLKPSTSEKEEQQKQSNPESCIWIPKTLRIDDPGEAARSSIWATLGIKNDKSESNSGAGHFRTFQSKADEKNHVAKTSQLLQANPAALSRSLNFHECS